MGTWRTPRGESTSRCAHQVCHSSTGWLNLNNPICFSPTTATTVACGIYDKYPNVTYLVCWYAVTVLITLTVHNRRSRKIKRKRWDKSRFRIDTWISISNTASRCHSCENIPSSHGVYNGIGGKRCGCVFTIRTLSFDLLYFEKNG